MDKIVGFPKKALPHRDPLIDRPLEVASLDDKTLVIMFTDCALEMKKRCHNMKMLSVNDDNGRLWSMPALMRYLNQVLNYITIAVGK